MKSFTNWIEKIEKRDPSEHGLAVPRLTGLTVCSLHAESDVRVGGTDQQSVSIYPSSPGAAAAPWRLLSLLGPCLPPHRACFILSSSSLDDQCILPFFCLGGSHAGWGRRIRVLVCLLQLSAVLVSGFAQTDQPSWQTTKRTVLFLTTTALL